MAKSLQQKLTEKGWSKEEIEKATQIMESPPEKGRAIFTKRMNPLLYWMTLIVAIVGNMVISVVLIPFLIAVQSIIALYSIIALLGLAFGFLFSVLLTDIEHIDPKHHVIAGIFIPILALINIFIIVNITNTIDKVIFGAQIQGNAIIISGIYVLAFIGPYMFNKLSDIIETKKRVPA
ncbi:hypothetical protein ACFLZ7_00200 [Nanoarchaeota archaeon]